MKKILVFLLTIVVLSVCSCRSSKTDTTVHQDNTEQKQTEQEEVSTDKAQVSVNKNVERMIEMMQQMEFNWQKTNYSPPDSTKVSISCSAIFFAIFIIGLGLILNVITDVCQEKFCFNIC